MPDLSKILYMKMTNGEYIYGTNKDIGRYSVEKDCECEHEFDHINPSTLYSKFTYVGKDHNPTKFETSSTKMDYELGKLVTVEKW